MRRFVGILFVVFALTFLIAGPVLAAGRPGAPKPNPRTIPFVVYFVGDSITKGRAATTEDNTYRKLLIAQLQLRPTFSVASTGVYGPGWHAADALSAVTASPPRANTALIVLAIGTNDASGNLGASQPTSPATFTSQYAQLVARLRAAAPAAMFVCLTTWWDPTTAATYNAAIAVGCPGGRVVDLGALYANPAYHGPSGLPENWYQPGMQTDTVHPNDAGMAAIAGAIGSALDG